MLAFNKGNFDDNMTNGTYQFSRKDASADRSTNVLQEKFIFYKKVCDEFNKEEERLQYWMLMSIEDKLDMISHEMISEEAQIMFYLIESEFGSHKNQNLQGLNLKMD